MVEQVKIGNARYLYSESEGVPPDLRYHLNAIDHCLMSADQVRYANERVTLFFFCSPFDESFDAWSSWTCREVIGHIALDEESEVQVFDGFAGDCFRSILPWPGIELQRLQTGYQAVADFMSKQQIPVSDSWRVQFQLTQSSDNQYDFKTALELFRGE